MELIEAPSRNLQDSSTDGLVPGITAQFRRSKRVHASMSQGYFDGLLNINRLMIMAMADLSMVIV